MRYALPALLLIGGIGGCGLLTDGLEKDAMHVSLVTTDRSYTVQERGAAIDYEILNEGEGRIYYGTCISHPAHILDKRVDGEWKTVLGTACKQDSADPAPIEPGTSYRLQLDIDLDSDGRMLPRSEEPVEGTYRLRQRVLLRWDREEYEQARLPEEKLISNTFDIRRLP